MAQPADSGREDRQQQLAARGLVTSRRALLLSPPTLFPTNPTEVQLRCLAVLHSRTEAWSTVDDQLAGTTLPSRPILKPLAKTTDFFFPLSFLLQEISNT